MLLINSYFVYKRIIQNFPKIPKILSLDPQETPSKRDKTLYWSFEATFNEGAGSFVPGGPESRTGSTNDLVFFVAERPKNPECPKILNVKKTLYMKIALKKLSVSSLFCFRMVPHSMHPQQSILAPPRPSAYSPCYSFLIQLTPMHSKGSKSRRPKGLA